MATITKYGRLGAVVMPVEDARRAYPTGRAAALLMRIPYAVETERDPSPLREVDL
jgi:hypothetical protein